MLIHRPCWTLPSQWWWGSNKELCAIYDDSSRWIPFSEAWWHQLSYLAPKKPNSWLIKLVIRFSQVIIVLETVDCDTFKRWARSTSPSPNWRRTITKKDCSIKLSLGLDPRLLPCCSQISGVVELPFQVCMTLAEDFRKLKHAINIRPVVNPV